MYPGFRVTVHLDIPMQLRWRSREGEPCVRRHPRSRFASKSSIPSLPNFKNTEPSFCAKLKTLLLDLAASINMQTVRWRSLLSLKSHVTSSAQPASTHLSSAFHSTSCLSQKWKNKSNSVSLYLSFIQKLILV